MMTYDRSRGGKTPTPWTGVFLMSLAIGCGSPVEDYTESGGDSPGAAGESRTDFEAGSGAGSAGSSGSSGSDVDGSGHPVDPDAGIGCRLAWSSGFETGFPGEWLAFENGYSPDGTMNPGRVSSWTIVGRSSGEPVFSGESSYRGWIEGTASENHRAYPVIHSDISTPLVNTFMVYLAADYNRLGADDWIHFGTWGNADDQGGGQWALHTLTMHDHQLKFAHTSPFTGEYIGPSPQTDFPTGRWVRLTVYLEYNGGNGFVQVWQDGVPMLRAEIPYLADYPGTQLTRAHWGMYAAPSVDHGTQYNDEIQIWSLDAPLTDLETEPDCYLAP